MEPRITGRIGTRAFAASWMAIATISTIVFEPSTNSTSMRGFMFRRFASSIEKAANPSNPNAEDSRETAAKEYMPGRRMPGYEGWKSPDQQRASTMAQAKAIYRALQQTGVSYVKSSLTFGRNTEVSERVRMPGQAIISNSANCIDGVLMYASLFENLDMDPVVVRVAPKK